MPSPDRGPTSGKLSRRDFLRLTGASIGGLALGGCASPASPAEAGPKPPTVNKPDSPVIPSATPDSHAVPISTAKPAEATPTPEAGGITNVTIFGREYPIIDLGSNIGGGVEATGIEAFKQAARTSPFKIFHPVSEDRVVAGLQVAKDPKDPNRLVVIAEWTKKQKKWYLIGEDSSLELLRAKNPKVNYRSAPVLKDGKLIAGMKLGTLVNEGTKIDIVAAVPGQKPIPALDESGVKHDWQSVFLRVATIDLGNLDPKNPDATSQAVIWVADEYMAEIVQEAQKPVEARAIPVRTIGNEQRPWKLVDEVKGSVFNFRVLFDPMTEKEALGFVTLKSLNIPSEIKIDTANNGRRTESKDKELSAKILESDDLGLAHPKGSGVEALENAVVWVLAKATDTTPKDVIEKVKSGKLKIEVGGQEWDPRKGIDVNFYLIRLNEDTHLEVHSGLGYGFKVRPDGVLELSPQILGTGAVPLEDYNRTGCTRKSLERFAKALGVKLDDYNGWEMSFPLDKIVGRRQKEPNGTFTFQNMFVSK